ncbi:MAG: GDP-L-fucose synthase [Cyclobacteriaceae bacterium]|nr:GDP-L-fucose synthase [Cyclobacteriaceae bacterium]
MEKSAKIYVAGHRGMVGSAIVRKLEAEGYKNLILKTSKELDLRNQQQVKDFFEAEKPEYVFLAAAKVGGIVANNTYRAEFIYDNLMIESNIIHHSYLNNVKKLLFLGSSCIYPKLAPQPLTENYLLTGELESTNEPYAIAKIAGIKMCDAYRDQYGCNFISAMPTNLYGPNDNYNLETSHVLPALIRKMVLGKALESNDWETLQKDLNKRPIEGVNGYADKKDILSVLAKYGISSKEKTTSVTLWGTGEPLREFLHVDDLAEACLFLMNKFDKPGFINVGSGIDLSIKELAEIIKTEVGFSGHLVWDTSKPNGTPRKLMDVSKLKGLGWINAIPLKKGISKVVKDYEHRLKI